MPDREPIRVAVIGAGAIARGAHLPALRAVGKRVEVVALVDLNPDLLAATADEWGIPGRYDEVPAMLEAEKPGLVVVCTPPGVHKHAAIAALDAGAWVWCEKPPTLSLAEYDDIAGHEGENGPYAAYVFQHRFGTGAERLRRHLAEGTLGRLLVGVCNTLWYRDRAYFEVPWRGRWATEGGGPTMGHGIHQMDLLLSILGDWTEVTAVMSTSGRDVETEDLSLAILRFDSGAIVSIVNSLLSPREASYFRFDFEEATVELEHVYGYSNGNWQWTPAPHVTDESVVASWQPESDVESSHLPQLQSLLDSIERGQRPRVSGADGRRVLELIAAMYQSALERRPVGRSELTPENRYYAAMNGGDPTAATTAFRTAAGRG